jgi:hypothetical protein
MLCGSRVGHPRPEYWRPPACTSIQRADLIRLYTPHRPAKPQMGIGRWPRPRTVCASHTMAEVRPEQGIRAGRIDCAPAKYAQPIRLFLGVGHDSHNQYSRALDGH